MKAEMSEYFRNLLEVWQAKHGGLPSIPYDEEVEPFIYSGEPDEEGWISWRPVEKTGAHDMADVEEESGLLLHPSVKEYFNCFWFCSLGGRAHGRAVQLEPVRPGVELEDFTRNLRGYKSAHGGRLENVPVGFETEQGLLVVVDNETGEVKLEDYEVGSFEPLAADLGALIKELSQSLKGEGHV